ncbi:MAG TPA: (2Fe-2S)-binding protein [Chloroflexota bacterium]|nr:(2Fe-2S)-binding protein [Chloroflexota bacterium]
MKHTVRLTVNRRPFEEEADSRQLLVHFIRETLGLTGTHVGCVIGECGACSVLLDGKVVKSCLMLAAQADGCELTTIEGLEQDGTIHPLQAAFIAAYGVQCGYCTPGMILAGLDLLSRNPQPTEGEIRKALEGNLCMCTGYTQIVRAIQQAAATMAATSGGTQ